nr:hypothetical protein [Tanacetum cinerariifolium]
GLRRSTLNHLLCMSYTDVAQVANAARSYEILHERDDQDTESPDKQQKSGDRHQPTTQQSSHRNHGHNNDRHGSDKNSGNGRDQRNRGQQSNRSVNSGNSSHLGECRRAAGTCFKCGQTGHLQKDYKKNTTASTFGQADKKPDHVLCISTPMQDSVSITHVYRDLSLQFNDKIRAINALPLDIGKET